MKQPLRTVATGFGFLLTGAVLPVVLFLIGVALTALLVRPEGGHNPGETWIRSPVRALALIMAFLIAGATMFGFMETVGSFLCLAVPPESRASEIVVASLALHIVGLLLNAARALVVFIPVLADWQTPIAWVHLAVVVVGKGLFLLFVYRLGVYLNRPDVSRAAWRMPIMLLVLVGVAAAFMLLLWYVVENYDTRASVVTNLSDQIAIALIVLGLTTFMLALVVYFRYLGLLRRSRDACAAAL